MAVWNAVLIAAGVAMTWWLGWRQRWIADDGLIVLRTVRQVLAGNGPVFNAGERVEVNTSTAWTAVLAIAGSFPGVQLDLAAVFVGLTFAALGIGLGIDAARRLHHGSRPVVLVPVGAVVLLVLPPARDFLTSGLETGLVILWLSGSWWLLVRISRGRRAGPQPWLAAVTLGAGPLIRPELGIYALLCLLVLVGMLRPGWRRLLGLGAAAGALPVVYEIFRVGYYGLLVPATALAKEAARTRWHNGVVYLQDTVATYWLWVPAACALLVLAALVARGAGWADRWATVAVTVTPMVAGLLTALYVVRVGGDFMHGRMLLPAVTALLLPVFAVPLTLPTLLPVLAVAVWAAAAVTGMRVDYGSRIDPATGIVDERAYWSDSVDVEHPVTARDYLQGKSIVRRSTPAVALADQPSLMLVDWGRAYDYWRPYPAARGFTTIQFYNLGMMGAAHPLDVRVIDHMGLAAPLAAQSTPELGGRIGHDKGLPLAWLIADQVDRGIPTPGSDERIRHARQALACPRIQEMLASVRAPLTPQRFWHNLIGAPERTAMRFSRLPERAAEQCAL
ncbi:MAG: hypothetical protein GEV09_24550 [Pseudonocardiaceae bacterium]|nr:hypothetical protein [Pseudonocardiaceae bacterium]